MLQRKLTVVVGRFRGEEFDHGGFGEVAAVEDLPFVVEFGQDRGGESVEDARPETALPTHIDPARRPDVRVATNGPLRPPDG
ncbi:hypothetical protein GCM10011579_065760 [Streptomyces albiflavescens]|uniref:Uncharacterized protein n=1 Tax=Streptomyces albiflavescens TaxID=1623582 RepID=A0A917Y9D4_9ACTN|nr:hypothetical protein [Streptomyces albiflavescens]GGN80330.1 hypothetical protein GCM10011579_065760 [Streptomyces albiflavescens]